MLESVCGEGRLQDIVDCWILASWIICEPIATFCSAVLGIDSKRRTVGGCDSADVAAVVLKKKLM